MSYNVPHPSGDGELTLLSGISGFCKPGEVCLHRFCKLGRRLRLWRIDLQAFLWLMRFLVFSASVAGMGDEFAANLSCSGMFFGFRALDPGFDESMEQ